MRNQVALLNIHGARAIKCETRSREGVAWRRLRAAVLAAMWILSALLAGAAGTQQEGRGWTLALSDDYLKSGPSVLNAFKPVEETTRASIVIVAVDGWRAALGTVIDTNGYVLTKASELKPGKLTCTLSSGREVPGAVVATDDDNDVALVKISPAGLKPIAWAPAETTVGQWVATPGLGTVPEAVGIVSVHPRKILPKRAMIGVILEGTNDSPALITRVTPGFGADKAGLRAGDIVIAVNGVTVTNRQGLTDRLREIREGKIAKLRVKRGDTEFAADVEMTAESKVMTAQYGGWRGFGRGFDRQDVMNRMGSDVSDRAEDFSIAIQHDTVLEPWQCGGPLVNLEGKAVGLNIARAGRVASYALPASLVKRIISELKSEAAAAPRRPQVSKGG